MKEKKKLSLPIKIFIGMALGILAGLAFAFANMGAFTKEWIKPIGTIYVNLLKFLVVPVVLFSIADGVISLQDLKRVGSVGLKTFIYYMFTTALAVVIGLVLVNIFKGAFTPLPSAELGELAYEAKEAPTVMQVIVNIFPDNLFKPMVNTDMLPVIVIAIFLGADEKLYEGHRVYGTFSLEGAAVKAAQLLGAKTHDFGFTDEQIKEIVAREMRGYSAKQKYFRGLYCGGTFTEEGLIYYSSHVKNARLHSNLNTAYAEKLASHLHSEGHSILDLGSEEFTACSPHPVFDPEIRLKRFRQELQDDEVAVILLDFITGPGVAKEPVKEFAIEAKKAIAEKHITVISNICGSAEDPQNIELQAKMLRDAGVIVTDSNYQSARLAAALMSALNERG